MLRGSCWARAAAEASNEVTMMRSKAKMLERQNLFAIRIEVEPALLYVRDVAQMRSHGRAVADLHIAIGQLPRPDARQEVFHVVLV